MALPPGRLSLPAWILVGMAFVGVYALVRHSRKDASGNVTADATPIGSFSFLVSRCVFKSPFGQPGGLGFDLRGKEDFLLRVAGNGDDARLSLYQQGFITGAIPLGKQDCSRWDVAVERVGIGNRLKGHLHVTCKAGAGSVSVDTELARCNW